MMRGEDRVQRNFRPQSNDDSQASGTNSMAQRQQILQALDSMLEPERFRDAAPNGLQVEGSEQVGKILSGVTASLALIEAAVERKAQALLVHHGLFWRGQDGRITGWMKRRLSLLLEHDINLFAYHLPLDAHPKWGNNAQLGQRLGLSIQSRFGEQDLGCLGEPAKGSEFPSAKALHSHVESVLGRPALMVGKHAGPIKRIGWCTGGAQSYLESAITAGAQAYLTGEISEPQAHYARECGVVFLACGHHATERYGAPAVGAQIAMQLGLEHEFVDIDNPA